MTGPAPWYRRLDAKWWFILAFFLMCCAYEVGRVLHLRPQPHHLWRQSDCIALAWNYYDTTWNLFEPALRIQFADGYTSGKSAGEFPVLYWIVGMLWRITGPSEFTYRLIGLLLHFAGVFALFSTLRRIIGDAFWAGCTALLFYASPVLVYFGVGFLTDVPAFDLGLIGWWYVVRYVQERKRAQWGWAVFFFTLAMSMKVTAGMSLLALAGVLFWTTLLGGRLKGRWSAFEGSRFEWVLLMAGLVAVYAWYAYAAAYNDRHGAKYTFNDLWPIWDMTPLAREWAWTVGSDIIVFQVFDTSVWLLMGVALVSLVADLRRVPWQVSLLLATLLLGSVLYLLCWFNALDNHDYYFINPMVTLAVLLAAFLWSLARHYPELLNARWSRWSMAALLLFNTAYTAQNMAMRYDTSGTMSARKLLPIYHEAELRYWNDLGFWGMDDLVSIGPRLREMGVREEDKVIFLDDGALNSSLVLMGNRGWTAYGIGDSVPERIERYIAAGARYLMFSRQEWLDDPRMARYLERPIGQVGSVRIFSLTDDEGLKGERVVVFDPAARPAARIGHRLDTVSCEAGDRAWCFGEGAYPFDIGPLPTYGRDVRFATVLVEGVLSGVPAGDDGFRLMMGEDLGERQLALWHKPLSEGPFSVRFSIPPRPEGTRNNLFISNRAKRPFTIEGLKVEVTTYHAPDRSEAGSQLPATP